MPGPVKSATSFRHLQIDYFLLILFFYQSNQASASQIGDASLCGISLFKMQYTLGGFYASIYGQAANVASSLMLASPGTITNPGQSFHPYYFNPAASVCPVYQQPIQGTGRLAGKCGLPSGESCDNCCSFAVCACSQDLVESDLVFSNRYK